MQSCKIYVNWSSTVHHAVNYRVKQYPTSSKAVAHDINPSRQHLSVFLGPYLIPILFISLCFFSLLFHYEAGEICLATVQCQRGRQSFNMKSSCGTKESHHVRNDDVESLIWSIKKSIYIICNLCIHFKTTKISQ